MISTHKTIEEKTPVSNFSELKYSIPLPLLREQINDFKNEAKGLQQIYKDCMRITETFSIKFNGKHIPASYFPENFPSLDEVKKGSVKNFEMVHQFLIEQLTLQGFLKVIKLHDQIEIGMYCSFLFDFLIKNNIGTHGANKTFANYTYEEVGDKLILQTIICGMNLHNKDNPEASEADQSKEFKHLIDLFKNSIIGTELIQESDNLFTRKIVTNNHNITIELFKSELSNRIQTIELKHIDQTNKKQFNTFSNFFRPINNANDESIAKEPYLRLIETITNKINTKKFAFSLGRLNTLKQMDQFISDCINIHETFLPKIDLLKMHLKKILMTAVANNENDNENWNMTLITATLKTLNILEVFWSFESLTSAAVSHILKNTTSFIDRLNQRFENFKLTLVEIKTYQDCLQNTSDVMVIKLGK
ncbi:MAG: hypothetical protein JO131_08815 [Gammaproteobacteria bacterium]|nr:hypothetical protein [Gammaproteobacteria bacterium]